MALIYEYMSNGDLKEHMSGKIITKCLVLVLCVACNIRL